MQTIDPFVMEDRSWTNFPTELLETILSKLPLSDHPKFACVCKDWNKITSPVYPADRSPLLAYFRKWRDGNLRYYSPLLNKSFKVDFPSDLSKARLYSSKDGWLVLCRNEEVILVNPFTDSMHKFPGLIDAPNFTGITFAGQPPDKCCIFAIEIVLQDYVAINFWNGKNWQQGTYENNIPFVTAPHSNPVVWSGHFCCLGEDGNIGIYDINPDVWSIVKTKNYPSTVEESYLVEHKGYLRAIIVGNHKSTIQILELRPKEVWVKITNLETQTLFIGPRIPLISTNLPKKLDNIVFFSRMLGTPDEIEAEIRYSERRIYFVPKKSAGQDQPVQGSKKTSEGGIYTYNLKTRSCSEYRGSSEYPCSIWYEPRVLGNV